MKMMDAGIIRSRHNALVKHARAVRERRASEDRIFIEGLRLSEEALNSRLNIQEVLYTEKLQSDARGERLLGELRAAGCRITLLSEEVLAYISDTSGPQGIVLLASRPKASVDKVLAGPPAASTESAGVRQPAHAGLPLIVVIHGINNPSNAGAILRTAEAAGASAAIATKGTADIFSPKALRGAMGSSFRLPALVGADFAEVVSMCRSSNIRTIGASTGARLTHTQADWRKPCALFVGSEAAGLTDEEASMLDEAVRIPMQEPVESLNVAVASGIILYEAARQRGIAGIGRG